MKYKSVDIIGKDVKGNDVIPYLVEVELNGNEKDMFLIVAETLTRIGLVSKKPDNKELFQTCHILQKRGKFYILNFKFMFLLDGRQNSISTGDIARQNTIIDMLEEWELINVVDETQMIDPMCSLTNLAVLSHEEAKNYKLTPKYKIGKKK